jgi:hypothetical protein
VDVMKTKLLLVMFVFLGGCGLPEESRIATAVSETLIAETQLTKTLPPTLVPTQTSKPKLIETHTPMPTPTISVDLSKISLNREDLTKDFFPIPPLFIDFSENEIQDWYSGTDITVMEAFFFTDEREQRYIIGWTIRLPERLEATGFDTVMRHHEYVLVNAVAGLGGEEILERETLLLDADIGNDFLGLRLLVKEEEEPYRMWVDAILFQRDFIGVTVFEAYEDWLEPLIGIENIANILDRKTLEVLRP